MTELSINRGTHAGTTCEPNRADAKLESIDQGLEQVIGDVNRFLSDFCLQVEVEASSLGAEGEQNLQSQTEALKIERELWEARRAREEQRIKDKSDQLTAAWLRLEEEQRRQFFPPRNPPHNDLWQEIIFS